MHSMAIMPVSLHTGRLVMSRVVVKLNFNPFISTVGSGKSYTMMGAGMDNQFKGLIPRICDELFEKISKVAPHVHIACK